MKVLKKGKYYSFIIVLNLLLSEQVFAGGIGNGSDGSPGISGIVNTYTNVLSITSSTCTSGITVFSATGLNTGDLILIIQMEGATINTTNTAAYGNILNYNNSGNFEYARIFSVAGNVVQTVAPLTNVYTTLGAIQLIKVPQYLNPTITGTLTCPAWNGLTGGVLALDAIGTITFNADIDISNNGFRGGQYQPGSDFHLHLGDYTALSYPDSFSLKGEGIATYAIAPNASGRGAAANGGGGGNNHNAGGGGGSNGGCGGNGGYGFSDILYGLNYIDPQGLGGYPLPPTGSPSKIFMGGGGGAGNSDNASVSSGGNGGGIAFITANTINGNSNYIRSNGSNCMNTVVDGAGGGGAGGSIMLDCSSFNSFLNLSATGGNGGNGTALPYNPHGPGGGGGGGLIAFSGSALPANVAINSLTGGIAGLCDGLNHGTTPGCAGATVFNFSYPKLVTNPTTTTFSDTVFCNSGMLTLTSAPGTTYSWSPAAGLSCTNCQNTLATVNSTTTYVATVNLSSCIFIDSFLVTINPLPNTRISPLMDVCIDAPPMLLTGGSPAGGTYSGTGVNAGIFDPFVAGAGSYAITYTCTDSNNCVKADSAYITVNPLPVVSLASINPMCISEPSFTLNGGSPAGGTYSGPGVTGGTFDPATAGSGTHYLVYAYSDANGCVESDSITITIYDIPVVSFGPVNAVCEGFPAFALSGGLPAGGIYSGSGVAGSTFNPAVSGNGSHLITYTYTDLNGCSAADSTLITVNALPVVTLGAFSEVCADLMPFPLIGGLPAGGTYSGTGVNAGNFDPGVTGTGIFAIEYVYMDVNGCSDSAVNTISVNSLPVVTLLPVNPFCISVGSFMLNNGNPASGIYSGTGVTGGLFDPVAAGTGSHLIHYHYTDSNGCSSADSTTFVVYGLPVVSIPALSPVCEGTPAFNITGGLPAGGSYSGNGISGLSFDPSIAGPGIHTIAYTYADANGCINSDSTNLTVNALPNVLLNVFSDVCIDAAPFAVTGGSPIGGAYSGTGINAGIFNPALSGLGVFPITYNYTDANGCSGSAIQTITIHTLPVVTLAAMNPVCISASAFTLNNGAPVAGNYSGNGITANTFNPAGAGAGVHVIYYFYSDINGCGNLDSTTITVYDLPAVTIQSVNAVCEGTPSFSLSGATPAGGSYSGAGVGGNNFNPAAAGTGNHLITYSYTDINGCSNSSGTTITVNALPVVTLGSFASVCPDSPPFMLTGGNPSGGSYLGTGIATGTFDPFAAGSGMHAVTYAYTDVNGCSNSKTKTITVHPLPVVTLSAITPVCIASPAFQLTSGSPAGGTYSGTGVSSGNFNPAVAGMGSHIIYYSYTDGNGCSGLDSTTITVYVIPAVSIAPVNPVCLNTPAFTISSGTPSGGTYSGAGMIGNTFNPLSAGAGTHTITYSYTDSNGCSNSANVPVTVHAFPVVALGSFTPVCLDAPSFVLSNGTPAGGIYSGSGINAGIFDPLSAGAGSASVQYAYTDLNGCTNSATNTIIVYPIPVVTLAPINPVCIASPSFQLTTGLPAGGTYSGPGVSAGIFSPVGAGLGTHTILYSFTDGNGCSATDTTTVTVYDIPFVSIAAVNPVCDGTPAFAISGGSPVGGTYSGTGITGNVFNPAIAGIGNHQITYAYTDPNGCASSANITITVNALPVVTLGGFTPVCMDGPAFMLTGGSPAGGSYSGTGVNAGSFSPILSGPGNFTITYSYSDANGCMNDDSESIVVNPLPVVSAGVISPVCILAPPFILNTGFPVGGTYSGNGVTGLNFDPVAAGTGIHTIKYSYNDAMGCSNTDSTSVTVNDLPNVNISALNPVCLNTAPFLLSAGTPAGGSYSGSGVGANMFNAAVAGTGNQTITYSFTDMNGCSDSASAVITVNPLPVVVFNATSSVCENASSFVLSGGSPSGGIYSGIGVLSGIFNPQAAGNGIHPVSYIYTDSNGCSNTAIAVFTVNPMILLNAGADATACSGQPVQLNVSGSNSVTWSPSTGLSCNTCINPVATLTQNTVYVISSTIPCAVNDTLSIAVVPAVVVDAGSDSTICYGESIQLNASSNATVYNWNPAGALSCLTCSDPVATPLSTSSFMITATNGICSATDSVLIHVTIVQVDAGPNQQVILGAQAQLDATGAGSYLWSPGSLLNDSTSSSPVTSPETATTYTVIGYRDGCSDTDQVIVYILDIGDAIYVPNAFTPNGDGKNDVFGAVYYGAVESYSLKIYSRWGALVFETGKRDEGWDGSSGNQDQPEGVYVYNIQLRTGNHLLFKRGKVQLIR